MKTKNKGFTLIELLVVVSIIGLLSSVVLTTFSRARAKARDVRKVQDLRAMKTAVELYFADQGKYPKFDGVKSDIDHSIDDGMPQWQSMLGAALSPYIKKLPNVTTPTGIVWHYYFFSASRSDGLYYLESKTTCNGYFFKNGYYFQVQLEASPDIAKSDAGALDSFYEVFGGDLVNYNPCTSPRPT